MTRLGAAARAVLRADPAVTALVGRSAETGPWIFERIMPVQFEGSGMCAIVVEEDGEYTSAVANSGQRFPRLRVTISADATRTDTTVSYDAQSRLEAIAEQVNRHFHPLDRGGPDGGLLIWGSSAQIAAKTAVIVTNSRRLTGPTLAPLDTQNVSWAGEYTYGVDTF